MLDVESTEAIRAFEPSLSSWLSVGVSGNVSGGWDVPQKMKVVETEVRGLEFVVFLFPSLLYTAG